MNLENYSWADILGSVWGQEEWEKEKLGRQISLDHTELLEEGGWLSFEAYWEVVDAC